MINLQDAWKRTMNTLGNSPMGLPIKTSGTIFNATKKLLKTQATPSLNYTPMSTSALQAMITPKTNTQDVKSSTLSQPKYNPEANVMNQNFMNNYTGTGNIDLNDRPQVKNPDGSISTVLSKSFNIDGREILLPTIRKGLDRPMTDDEAINWYKQTGENLGSFGSITEANNAANKIHIEQQSKLNNTPAPAESEADKWFKMYQQSMAMTPQEEALQNQLSNLTTGADLGVAGLEGQGRGIPLSLVRGQQEKLLKQAAIQTQPLQKQLELLQAKRQAQMEGAKAGMDYFKEESQAFSPMKVGAGETLIDPRTGQMIYQGPAKTEKQDFSNLKEVQGGLYNMATGQWEIQPKTSTGTPANNIKSVQGGLFDINTNSWIVPPKGAETTGGSEYSKKITQVAKDTIKEIEPQVNKYTTGWGGLQLAKVAGTPAYNFASALDTLKSNIAFGALVQMREASKTGGALGQVSDREGQLLQSSLGALNQGQSPEAFKTQLKKIMESLDRWNSAVEKYGGGATGESLAQQVDALGYDYNQMIADGYDEDDIRNAVGL
jgi:hypothetical protein